MRKLLLYVFAGLSLSACEKAVDDEKQKNLEDCKSQLSIPELKINEYFEHTNGNQILISRYNALNGKAHFFIQVQPDIWRYQISFEPVDNLAEPVTYPVIEYLSNENWVGIEEKGSIYEIVNATPGNQWMTYEIPTYTADASYRFKVRYECSDESASDYSEVIFHSAKAHEIFPPLSLRFYYNWNSSINGWDEININIEPPLQHNITQFQPNTFRIYAISEVKDSSNYRFRYDFQDITSTDIIQKSFMEISGLAATQQYQVQVQTRIYAEFTETGESIDSVLFSWPVLTQ